MRNILIVGASRGLGNSMIEGIGKQDDHLFLVSRTKPYNLDGKQSFQKTWIQSNLGVTEELKKITGKLNDTPLDVIIFNAGTWEKEGFEKLSEEEIINIITVNLSSVILLTQRLLPNLRQGKNKKIIFIGSTCGLENEGSDSIVYNSTKFALRGMTHALREYVRKDLVAVTCISPGSIATDVHYNEGTVAALEKHSNQRIPVSDLVDIINVVINSSNATCIKEIHVPALLDDDI